MATPSAPGTAIEPLAVTLGGAPLPQPLTGSHHDRKARKQRKRELKLRSDAERPPDSFERWRILSELVNEGRRVVDLADHKARYALASKSIQNGR